MDVKPKSRVEKETEKIAKEKEVPGGEEKNPLLAASRKILLAGIGAMALAQDEIEEFVNRLIERGEIAEKDGRKLVDEVIDRRKKIAHEAEEKITRRLEQVLERLNVPTKADIEALSEKIAALSRKIDDLKKEKPRA